MVKKLINTYNETKNNQNNINQLYENINSNKIYQLFICSPQF